MSFDWANFVLLAEDLVTLQCKGGVEARLRSAVSRRYYGLFHQIRHRLLAQNHVLSAGIDVHQEVVQALRTSRQTARVKLGIDLGRLRQYRNSADYDDAVGNIAQIDNASSAIATSMAKQLTAINWQEP